MRDFQPIEAQTAGFVVEYEFNLLSYKSSVDVLCLLYDVHVPRGREKVFSLSSPRRARAEGREKVFSLSSPRRARAEGKENLFSLSSPRRARTERKRESV
jgi:hypothetical protein